MTQAPAALAILSHGPDLAAAEALALACASGVPLAAFTPALLDQVLAGGQRCAVVWSDPQTALAAALRAGMAPTEVAAHWTEFAQTVLARADQGDLAENSLILIDAAAIRSHEGAVGLGPALPFAHAMPRTATPALHDTAALLALLMLPHLPDLLAAWHRLRGASLSATLSPLDEADLDLLAGHGRALDLALQERDLLRDQLQSAVADSALTSGRQASEIALLRDQLLGLATGSGPTGTAPPAVTSTSQTTEIDLLRAQLLAIATLLQASDPIASPQAGPAATEELRLLRAHLTYLQSDLGLGGDVPLTLPTAPAPAGFEAAIARVLADLVQETDRRILAEREVQAARRTLRHLGVEPPSQPGRSAVAPRPED